MVRPDLALSEVVVGELKAHLHHHANQARIDLVAKVKGISSHWHRAADISAVEDALGIGQEAEVFAEGFFAAFAEAAAPVIVGVEMVRANGLLLRRYLGAEPPFSNKEAKKREFPDAMALSSLEAWARDAKTMMLVISGDNGWKEFCDISDYLICMGELPSALNLFNENAGVVVSRVLAKLAAGEAQALHEAIDATLESFLENIDLEVEADSSASYETDSVEPSVNSWRIYDPRTKPDVISADDGLLVFAQVPIHADVNFGIFFSFSHWDSVDREYMRLGSRTVNLPKEIEVHGDDIDQSRHRAAARGP